MALSKFKLSWQQTGFRGFWSDLAAGEHVVQVYENERTFLNTLEGFVGTGLLVGEPALVIATKSHREELEARLAAQGFDLKKLESQDMYVALDANATLKKVMREKGPDLEKFQEIFNVLYERLSRHKKNIRAFGEMVALLAGKGKTPSAIKIETYWNSFMRKYKMSLLCAYPAEVLRRKKAAHVKEICCLHDRVIAGFPHASTEILYSSVQ